MLAVLMLVIAIAAAVTAWFVWPSPESVPETVPVSEEDSSPKTTKLAVSVAGDVADPGLVEVPAGARVADAIDAAGGVSPKDADPGFLNLARKIRDGELVVVEAGDGEKDEDAQPDPGGADGEPADEDPGGSGDSGQEGEPVNLNQATEQELSTLPGVGPVTASNIITYREQNGGFDSVDQLTEVDGIGPATMDKMRDQVTV